MRLLSCFLFFYTQTVIAVEYFYPVASLGNGESILCIHQHNPMHIKLLTWNPSTNQTEQILSSMFNPANIQLLPNNTGFSFIDNGRLRIKSFHKRSPKAIDFDEPLFGINGLQWIDEHTCYCSAQYNENFALFELHDDGTLEILAQQKGSDYLYPQTIDDHLFYIERCMQANNTHYQIMHCTYHQSDNATLITDFGNIPIVFLTMLSTTQGFVLEHAQIIDSEQPITSFSYHQIIKEGDVWSKQLLFSFDIPTNLLLGEQKLFESLLPLLPRIVDNKISFIDCSKNNNFILEAYFFDLITKTTQRIEISINKGHYFVPMLCGNRFYCGGTLNTKKRPLTSFLT